jgi:hypothetical protein
VDTYFFHSNFLQISFFKSHVFKGKWFKDFVVRRPLKEEDEIGLHWIHTTNTSTFFRVLQSININSRTSTRFSSQLL